jgi:hypothetical protein
MRREGEGRGLTEPRTGILRDDVYSKKCIFGWKFSFSALSCHMESSWTFLNGSRVTYRYTAHAQSTSDSTEHEQLFSPGPKRCLFSYCSTLVKKWLFRKVGFQPHFLQCSRSPPQFLTRIQGIDAVKVTFQLKRHLFDHVLPTIQLKWHLFSLHHVLEFRTAVWKGYAQLAQGGRAAHPCNARMRCAAWTSLIDMNRVEELVSPGDAKCCA